MLKKIKKAIKHPTLVFNYFLSFRWSRCLSDDLYLKIKYRIIMGKKLDLGNPHTFNEKLQWLKLYDRKPIYTTMVDKYEAKKYVANIIGEEYIILTLGVWNSFGDINFDELPQQFVLKCTHDSGGLFICKDKSKLDLKKVRKKINKSLKRNYYYLYREWPYKNVKPRIIAERYIQDENSKELKDYKFFAFNGEVKAMFIATQRQDSNTETKFDFFDKDFNHLDFRNGHPNAEKYPSKPIMYDKMIELAEKLAVGIPQVRIDFYEVNKKIYFGEITFSHWSGLVHFEPEQWDQILGEWIKLPDTFIVN